MEAHEEREGHTEGPGLKVLSTQTWYGWGGCNICGSSNKETLIPNRVRYWDCDDGWTTGVLCRYCGEEATERGPSEDDYAYKVTRSASDIDLLADLLGDDLDGAESLTMDMA